MATLSLRVLCHSTAIEPMLDLPTTRGSVHSVFTRAANLLLGGRLLTLHARETACAPNGLVLALRANQKPLAGLQPGMAWIVERGIIAIPAANLRLDLQQSQRWNPRPQLIFADAPPRTPNTTGDCPTPASGDAGATYPAHEGREVLSGILKRLQHNLARLETFVLSHAPPDGLAGLAATHPEPSENQTDTDSALLRAARSATKNLLDGIAQQRASLARQGISALMGLGPGLTPSGDDVIIGFIAATILLGEALEQNITFYQRLSAEALAIAYSRTNKISSTWIEYAGRGEVAEHLGHLFEALVQSDTSLLEKAAQEVLNSGATSGGDILAGIMLGGRCLCDQATL